MLYKALFVDFKFITFEIRVSDHLNPLENSVSQLSIHDFHSVRPSLAKHVLMVRINGHN